MCIFLLMGFLITDSVWAMPSFDPSKMSDMSDFDPNNPVEYSGDTVKIGLMDTFSGPAAGTGYLYWLTSHWVAHDLNKRGGIMIDGKLKKIQIIKGDTQAKPAVTKKIAEKLCLIDKVDVLWGPSGSHLALVMQTVAKKYKIIYQNPHNQADGTMDGVNFNRYTFRTCLNSSMFGLAMAYYYSKQPVTKFYILCQDYSFGHEMADRFKNGLKKYKPDAVIVGEEYHPLFMKDFAPYMTKIKGTDAQVIYTGDWMPDGPNLIRQSVEMGVNLPVANLYCDVPEAYQTIGGEAGRGHINGNDYMITVDTPENKFFVKLWHEQWKKWGSPYNSDQYKHPGGVLGSTSNQYYWLYSVIERAGTTDPEKIIQVWEDDEYKGFTGVMKMRACDHQVVKDMFVTEFEYPNPWFENAAFYGKTMVIPSEYCTPPVPQDLDRCNK